MTMQGLSVDYQLCSYSGKTICISKLKGSCPVQFRAIIMFDNLPAPWYCIFQNPEIYFQKEKTQLICNFVGGWSSNSVCNSGKVTRQPYKSSQVSQISELSRHFEIWPKFWTLLSDVQTKRQQVLCIEVLPLWNSVSCLLLLVHHQHWFIISSIIIIIIDRAPVLARSSWHASTHNGHTTSDLCKCEIKYSKTFGVKYWNHSI